MIVPTVGPTWTKFTSRSPGFTAMETDSSEGEGGAPIGAP